MAAAVTVEPNVCPLCGKPNQCAMEAARASGLPAGPCWCSEVTIEAAVLARIAEPARAKVCMCAACAAGVAVK